MEIRLSLLIRHATEDDASVAVEVLRRSISDLCHEDHRDDPARLSSWLANKNVATWKLWLNQPEAFVLVAEEFGSVCGVGMATWDGQILLNYVHPDARFRGISTALLGALEKDAAVRGAEHASLESTRTARIFYLSRGYTVLADDGRIYMRKTLPMKV